MSNISNDRNIDDNISSDSSSCDDMNVEDFLINNNNFKRLYQIQHVKDNTYKFVYMGLYEKHPSVELFKFDYPNSKCIHFVNSKFVFEDDLQDNNLFDLMSLDSIVNGKLYSLIVGVTPNDENHNLREKIENNLEFDGFINIYLHNHDDTSITMLKKDLTYPGNDKLIYYLIAELKTDKIKQEYHF
jgi:hypothetical protein